MDRKEDTIIMTLAEYADIIRCDIIITRYHNQNDRYTVQFEGSEIKEGEFLSGIYGNADTIAGAIEDYVDKIKGKLLVIGAYTESRREYGVPNTLTAQ